MSVPWVPSWGVFVRTEPGLMSIRVDQGAIAAGPDASHPVLVLLEFGLLDPRPDGLSTTAEHEAIRGLEDRLSERVREAVDGWPVARMLTAGRVTLCFQAVAAPEPGDPAVGWAPYTVELASHMDSRWGFLCDYLAPNAAEQRQMATTQQMHVLRGHGDQLATERPVDWTITLPDAASVKSAAAELGLAGYRVSQPGDLTVTGTRSHNLELLTLVEFQEQVAAIAARHGGEYDGWGSPIVTTPPRRRWPWRASGRA
jgi:hypothetical protein